MKIFYQCSRGLMHEIKIIEYIEGSEFPFRFTWVDEHHNQMLKAGGFGLVGCAKADHIFIS